MDKQLITLIIVVAIVAGSIGYVLGTSTTGGGIIGIGDSSLEAKLDEVKKMFPPTPDSNTVYGQVKSVEGEFIVLDTPPSNPFDESPKARQVTVTDATKIVRMENKDMETIQKEQEDFQKKISSWKPDTADSPPTPPVPFIEKEISLSDIKVGDQLNVEASTLIRMKAEFTATKILVQTMASISAPTPTTSPITPTP